MHNRKDKTQNAQSKPRKTKALSNSLRLKSPFNVKHNQSVLTILNRLPILQTINNKQSHLQKLTSIWLHWCATQETSDSNAAFITDNASIVNLEGDALVIDCTHASVATLLKHRRANLLKTLSMNGFEQLTTVRIQISPTKTVIKNNNHKVKTDQYHRRTSMTGLIDDRKPSAESLKSIDATRSTIKNKQLAASLKRLSDTLKS